MHREIPNQPSDQATIIGAGELSIPTPPITPLRLLSSLPTPLLSALVLFTTSPTSLSGAFHVANPHIVPVKLLICKGFRSHFRQAFPERSSARRLALMLPVLALGPRRVPAGWPLAVCFLPLVVVVAGAVGSVVRSIVPSALG